MHTGRHVLAVEDRARIARFLTNGIRARGFAVEHGGTADEFLVKPAPLDTVVERLNARLAGEAS